MNKRQIALETLAAMLIILFLYASVSKFLDFDRFFGEINNQPLPKSWTPFLVWIIPCSEIGISAALLFERTRMAGFIASLALMTLFTLYTATILLHFFSRIPCSCGGVIRKLTWPQHLALNIFYVGISIIGIVLQRRKSFNSKLITKTNFT